jgi:MerR HTH family regulatory protein
MTYLFNATRDEAGKAIGISGETIRKWERQGKIPPHVYSKIGYRTVRYCLTLLTDWMLSPDDLQAQARSIEALNATRPSQQPRKAGRKAA